MRIGAIAGLAALALGAAALAAEELPGGEPPGEGDGATARLAATAGPKAAAGGSATAPCEPGFGCVTHLPLPRFVSLKGGAGNARRGPGLTHRIDWVFTRPGMPLMITAEYENWRRVEDQDGAGGWVHYALLSGVRTVLVTTDMAELHASAERGSPVVAQAEMGVVGRILECTAGWCRISAGGEKGWIEKAALWGVMPGETVD